MIHPLFDRARAAAPATLPDGPFRGVPIVVKDLDGTLAGAPYHGGNRLLKALDYTPDRHEPPLREARSGRLRDRRQDQHARARADAERRAARVRARRTTRGTRRTHAGGSSGGSAAAVAGGMVPVGARGRRRRIDPHPGEHVRAVRAQAVAWPRVARARRVGAVGRSRHAPRRVAERARQRGGARRARGLHDRRPQHRAAARTRRTRARSAPTPASCASACARTRRRSRGDRPRVHRGRRATPRRCSSRSATRSWTSAPAALDEASLMDAVQHRDDVVRCAPTSPRSPRSPAARSPPTTSSR